ncbi:hypothetical protein DQ392_03455 [Streptomyces reniochalinae]|uniref:Uncharacterized protein n=1 Tax=Streptomyces reniochalinae TaxID=2250578 RepID=A0A367F322_9ACTN|nr:hypothetical protein DQ392_03455 [Streptomyces reniochalinae]
MDTAVDSLEYAGLALQAVGTARNDADQGWASTYNWGVALTGAAGARTVFLEGRRALQPHPSDPPNIFAATLGAGRAAGAAMYGFADDSRVRSSGAGLQTVASLGEYARNRYNADQARRAEVERARRAEERAAEPAPQIGRPSFGDPFEMPVRERASGSDRGRGSEDIELRRRTSSRAPDPRSRREPSRAPEGERRRRDSSAAPQERLPRAVRPPREERDRRPPPSWNGTLPQSAAPRSMSGSSSSSEERRSRREASRAPEERRSRREPSRAPEERRSRREPSRAPEERRSRREPSRGPEARLSRPEPVANPTTRMPVRSRQPGGDGPPRTSDTRPTLRRSNTSGMSAFTNQENNTTRRRGGGKGGGRG